MLDTETGQLERLTLRHEGSNVRDFYASLPQPACVGIEATGTMHWFLEVLEELGIPCQVGDAAKIRAAEPRKQKHDRRDAELILTLLVEKRFPTIWLPAKEVFDLRGLLLHRHQWVRMRTKIQNSLQAIAWLTACDEEPKSPGASGAASGSTIVDDPSGSGTDYSAGHRCIPRRRHTVSEREGAGQLRRNHSKGIFQWSSATAGWPEQTGKRTIAISLV